MDTHTANVAVTESSAENTIWARRCLCTFRAVQGLCCTVMTAGSNFYSVFHCFQ